jgi:ribosomal-protein-alanine N-acetyltransferase
MEVKKLIKELLLTERLSLRKMKETDSPQLFKIWSNPEVTRYMNIENFSNEDQAKEIIRYLSELASQNKAIRYTIILKNTNQIIGTCGFNMIDFENAKAEIGYDIDSTYWGNGYGREAVSCLLDYAFEHLKFMRVEAKVEPENVHSINLLEKAGFTLEGTLRNSEKSKGEFIDLHIFSRLKTD